MDESQATGSTEILELIEQHAVLFDRRFFEPSRLSIRQTPHTGLFNLDLLFFPGNYPPIEFPVPNV